MASLVSKQRDLRAALRHEKFASLAVSGAFTLWFLGWFSGAMPSTPKWFEVVVCTAFAAWDSLGFLRQGAAGETTFTVPTIVHPVHVHAPLALLLGGATVHAVGWLKAPPPRLNNA